MLVRRAQRQPRKSREICKGPLAHKPPLYAGLKAFCRETFRRQQPMKLHSPPFRDLCWRDKVCTVWSEQGRKAVPMEILLNTEYMDILSPKGFVFALILALKCKTRGAFSMLATVCSTWVFLNRATSGRSIWKPLGNENHGSVRAANVMVSRVALLQYVLEAKRVFWLWEQPASSIQIEHDRMQEFVVNMKLAKSPVLRTFTWMGAFNAESPKGSYLYSTHPDVAKFTRALPTDFVASNLNVSHAFVDPAGKTRTSGGAGLKNTQGYTREFAEATVAVFDECQLPELRPITRAPPVNIFHPCHATDSWEDAHIIEVLQFLTSGNACNYDLTRKNNFSCVRVT